jgi:hypothetical protein
MFKYTYSLLIKLKKFNILGHWYIKAYGLVGSAFIFYFNYYSSNLSFLLIYYAFIVYCYRALFFSKNYYDLSFYSAYL